MIYDENGALEPLHGRTKHRCKVDGCKNRAAWRTPPRGGGEPVLMCGWHVLYGGSEWGHERRDEIVKVGPVARASALLQKRKNTHVPELDGRGRMNAEDSEKFLLGVKYTTEVVKSRFSGILRRQARMEAEAGEGPNR